MQGLAQLSSGKADENRTTMRLKTIRRIPLIVLAITVLSITAIGQVSDSLHSRSVRIMGRVIDPTTAGIPGTLVTLKIPDIDETAAEVRSGPDGRFFFPPVPAQAYEIRFQTPGFELLKFQAKRASEGGDYDVGSVVLRVPNMGGDSVEVFMPPSTPASPIKTTLCELVKEANHFHGEFVRLRAGVAPAGIDVDSHLSDSPCTEVVWPHFPSKASVSSGNDLLLLKRYVLEQRRGVVATLTGKFELVLVTPGKLAYSLKLESASELVVSPNVSFGPLIVRR
jgi:hypothetical protein